jgi:hypothetical protein
MPSFENNILGLVPQEDWIDVGFQVKRQNDPTDTLFGDEKTDNIMAKWQSIAAEFQIPIMAHFHGFDTEANTTIRVPVNTHNIEKGLIKVKINQSERMRELLRSGVRQDEMYDYVVNDGIRLADQVFTRSKVAKNEVLANGQVSINENNLSLTVDYGVPDDQKSLTLDFWRRSGCACTDTGNRRCSHRKGYYSYWYLLLYYRTYKDAQPYFDSESHKRIWNAGSNRKTFCA